MAEPIRPDAARFRRLSSAESNLERLAEVFASSSSAPALLRAILSEIEHSADPDSALNNFERFASTVPDTLALARDFLAHPDHLSALVGLFAGSQFLSEVLIADPESYTWLMQKEVLWSGRTHDRYRRAAFEMLATLTERSALRGALSRWRRREMLRLGLRDLLGIASVEEVARDISDLAEAIIDAAAQQAYQEVAARHGHPIPESPSWEEDTSSPNEPSPDDPLPAVIGMCVLGMGKLGGRELNFSSDIDLIFIYEAEGETTGRQDGTRRVAVISNHVFFARMGETMIRFLSERGPEGNLFRVDMRLRPEGGDGPLVRSLESFVTYLSSQARDWERLAYLKARVISGPSQLAERLYRVISSFVFAGTEAEKIVREVEELKLRIDREVIHSDLYEREVKRGYGGIREIEFVISAMQIIHGYTHQALRVRNTFLAIQRLAQVQVLSEEESAFYIEAYSFLRTIEHRLQMAEEHQTHTLPKDPTELELVARRCGYPGAAEFQSDYRKITMAVHERFVAFFQHDIATLEEANRDYLLILDHNAPPGEALAALARRGVTDENSLRLLHALAYGTRDVFVAAEGQRFFAEMLPSLLRLIAAAPRPEAVLPRLHSFVLAIKGITYYYEVIAHHPEILRLLVTLFGSSSHFSTALIAHPEFFDALISTRVLHESDNDPVQASRRSRLEGVFQSKLPQRRLVLLRRAVLFENLLNALRYLLELNPLPEILRGLSDTADLAIEMAMRLTAQKLSERQGSKPAAPDTNPATEMYNALKCCFTIVALGKYGGRELNFFGDLDVVFIYDATCKEATLLAGDQNPTEFFTNVADTLTTTLSQQMQGGRAYQVDARLRPHGRNAPLATEITQYEEYLRTEAEVWELQSLTRARVIWGNSTTMNRLVHAANQRLATWSAADLAREIVTMRARLEATEEGKPDILEVKRSPGGLVDVEFLLQFKLLEGGELGQRGNYFELLGAQSPDLPIPNSDCETLARAYQRLRNLETVARLVSDSGESSLPADPANRAAAARLLGRASIEELESQANDTMTQVRAIYQRTLNLPPHNNEPLKALDKQRQLPDSAPRYGYEST